MKEAERDDHVKEYDVIVDRDASNANANVDEDWKPKPNKINGSMNSQIVCRGKMSSPAGSENGSEKVSLK